MTYRRSIFWSRGAAAAPPPTKKGPYVYEHTLFHVDDYEHFWQLTIDRLTMKSCISLARFYYQSPRMCASHFGWDCKIIRWKFGWKWNKNVLSGDEWRIVVAPVFWLSWAGWDMAQWHPGLLIYSPTPRNTGFTNRKLAGTALPVRDGRWTTWITGCEFMAVTADRGGDETHPDESCQIKPVLLHQARVATLNQSCYFTPVLPNQIRVATLSHCCYIQRKLQH